MNKKFCSKLAEKVNGFYFASEFKLARILVLRDSQEDILKGFCIKNTRTGVSVRTWFCPVAHFSFPNDSLMFMAFEGWDFGGQESGLISNKVNGEFLSPKKDDDVMINDVADYIAHRIHMLEGVKTLKDFIKLSRSFPPSFLSDPIKLQLGLLYYNSGERALGENMIRESAMAAGTLRYKDVEDFLLQLDKGIDFADTYIVKIMERNRKYLEDNGFYK
ncbi:hypothetical protein [Shewanella woodyi]|uniref:hypothetical protein n=1 Tax=Shewanella woodyi TaxID=60961 RepID=UPI0007F8A3F3|nr:hypothetical protein [Shewanella woodyi]